MVLTSMYLDEHAGRVHCAPQTPRLTRVGRRIIAGQQRQQRCRIRFRKRSALLSSNKSARRLRTAMADRHSSPHSPAWLPFRRPHQSICRTAYRNRATQIAFGAIVSQIPCPRFSGCSLMALVTKWRQLPSPLSDAQRSAPEESAIAGDDIQRQHFVVELQLLTRFSPISNARSSSAVVADFSCQQRNHRSVRGSAGVAGPDVHRAGSNTDCHVRYLTVTPGDASGN